MEADKVHSTLSESVHTSVIFIYRGLGDLQKGNVKDPIPYHLLYEGYERMFRSMILYHHIKSQQGLIMPPMTANVCDLFKTLVRSHIGGKVLSQILNDQRSWEYLSFLTRITKGSKYHSYDMIINGGGYYYDPLEVIESYKRDLSVSNDEEFKDRLVRSTESFTALISRALFDLGEYWGQNPFITHFLKLDKFGITDYTCDIDREIPCQS